LISPWKYHAGFLAAAKGLWASPHYGFQPFLSLKSTHSITRRAFMALREIEWVKFNVFTAPATWK
jgi:hypothetical protein